MLHAAFYKQSLITYIVRGVRKNKGLPGSRFIKTVCTCVRMSVCSTCLLLLWSSSITSSQVSHCTGAKRTHECLWWRVCQSVHNAHYDDIYSNEDKFTYMFLVMWKQMNIPIKLEQCVFVRCPQAAGGCLFPWSLMCEGIVACVLDVFTHVTTNSAWMSACVQERRKWEMMAR